MIDNPTAMAYLIELVYRRDWVGYIAGERDPRRTALTSALLYLSDAMIRGFDELGYRRLRMRIACLRSLNSIRSGATASARGLPLSCDSASGSARPPYGAK